MRNQRLGWTAQISVARRPKTDGGLVSTAVGGSQMRFSVWFGSLCLSGCWLEHVDMSNPQPLDPEFYEAALKSQGQPGQGGATRFHSPAMMVPK